MRRGNIRTPISNCSIHKVKPRICEQISKSEVLDGIFNFMLDIPRNSNGTEKQTNNRSRV